MSVLDLARVIVYRFHEKGLEVFLLNNEMEHDPTVWKLPEAMETGASRDSSTGHNSISLEPITDAQGRTIKTYAIEGEWHDIPSIRGMLKHDINRLKSKIIEVAPEAEKGGFFAVKEAFKKLLPEEYEAVKELKSILRDRNLTKYI